MHRWLWQITLYLPMSWYWYQNTSISQTLPRLHCSVIAAKGGMEAGVHHRVNEGFKVLGALKGVMKNRVLGMNVKKVLYEKVVVPTVMYGSESWGMKVTERQKLNVFEMKCLRSMTSVSRLDRVRNEVVRERTGVRRELAARVDMNVLR